MKKQKTVRKHHNSGTVILTIILIAVLGFATYWVATNYETVKATFNGTKLYTQKEVTDAYNKGVGDKTSYEKQIAEWMTKYETVNAQVKELSLQLEDYKKTNAEDKAKIEEMEAMIEELNQQLEFCKEALKVFEEQSKAVVIYMFGNEVYKSVVVEKGTTLTDVPTIESTNVFDFLGWSLDGKTVIDTSTLTINENTKLIALIEYKMFELSEPTNVVDLETIAVNGLKTSHNFKVYFSEIEVEDDYDSATPVFVYATNGTETKFINKYNLQGYEKANLIVEKDKPITMNFGMDNVPSLAIKVTCNEDGVLRITKTYDKHYVTLYKLIAIKIEIVK